MSDQCLQCVHQADSLEGQGEAKKGHLWSWPLLFWQTGSFNYIILFLSYEPYELLTAQFIGEVTWSWEHLNRLHKVPLILLVKSESIIQTEPTDNLPHGLTATILVEFRWGLWADNFSVWEFWEMDVFLIDIRNNESLCCGGMQICSSTFHLEKTCAEIFPEDGSTGSRKLTVESIKR